MATNNDEIIQELKETMESSRDSLAIFVGTGPSLPLGIKNWDDLVKNFAEKGHVDINKIRPYLKEKQYPEAASEIYEQIGDHSVYESFMFEQAKPKNCDWTSFHFFTTKYFKTILTTNYDVAFENCYNDNNINFNVQKLPEFNEFTLYVRPTIVYLHGNNVVKRYIFRKEEYEYFYPSISGKAGSYRLERFLEAAISKMNIIFIGFSFDDKYFFNFLTKVINERMNDNERDKVKLKELYNQNISSWDHKHFVILSSKESETKKELENLKVMRVITYSDDEHAEIVNILKRVLPPESAEHGHIEEDGAHV